MQIFFRKKTLSIIKLVYDYLRNGRIFVILLAFFRKLVLLILKP